MRKTGHERRGGDNWISMGKGGILHKQHSTPRVSLFIPYKVAKGPGSRIPLSHFRFTCGVTESRKSFEFHDDWTLPEQRHRVMDEAWIGYSVFTERSASIESVQIGRQNKWDVVRNFQGQADKWADMSDDEEESPPS